MVWIKEKPLCRIFEYFKNISIHLVTYPVPNCLSGSGSSLSRRELFRFGTSIALRGVALHKTREVSVEGQRTPAGLSAPSPAGSLSLTELELFLDIFHAGN